MPQDIAAHLAGLYGLAAAQELEPRLENLMRRRASEIRPAPAVPTGALSLSQRDALLITYGDQVTEAGLPPLRSLAGFLQRHAAEVVTGVHVLPFYPSSSDDGFSVVDPYAVDPALGSWDDIGRLGERFDLMFDAVFNHVSRRSAWFQRFLEDDPVYRSWFVTVEGDPDLSQVVRPRALPLLTTFDTAAGPRRVWTTFSADQVDLNVSNPEVLLALLDMLLFYAARGARFVRLDAIAYLWKEIGTPCIHLPQTHRVVRLMRAVLDRVAPHVLIITETNVPHRDNISYFGGGDGEAQLVYNFALPPLVLHSISTGDATRLGEWAAALELPSDRVTFFNFLASHDGIGVNPARGILTDAEVDALVQRAQDHGGFVSYKHDPSGSSSPYELNVNYFDALSSPFANEPQPVQVSRFLVAHAIMLAMTGVPGIYFHSLFGSRGDRAGAEASGIPRRINRQKFRRAELDARLADPSSRPSQVLSGLGRLLCARRACPAFHPSGQQHLLHVDRRVLALFRCWEDHVALCLHNVSGEEVRVEAAPRGEAAELAVRRGLLPEGGLSLRLAPYEARWVTGP